MDGLVWELSPNEIEKVIEKYISDLGDKLDHLEITWFESENAYLLEFMAVPAKGIFLMPRDVVSCGPIARISKYKDGDIHPEALDLVREAGRKLYFELRKSHPVKRNLGLR